MSKRADHVGTAPRLGGGSGHADGGSSDVDAGVRPADGGNEEQAAPRQARIQPQQHRGSGQDGSRSDVVLVGSQPGQKIVQVTVRQVIDQNLELLCADHSGSSHLHGRGRGGPGRECLPR